MSDRDMPPLTAKARALLAEERTRPPLDDARIDALWSRVQASVGPVGGGGTGGDGPAPHGGGAGLEAAATTVARASARTVGAFVATFAVGAAVGAATYATVAGPRPHTPIVEVSSAKAVAPAASLEVAAPSTAIAAEDAPARPRAPSSSSRPEGSTPTVAPAVVPAADRSLAAERSLIDRGRMALARGDGQGALAAADEHRARFAHGQLEEEREALAIRALIGIGRRVDARVRLDAFEQRHPKSLFLAPLRAIASE